MTSQQPDKPYLLDLFERITPPDFSGPIKEHESYAIIRAKAEMAAQLQARGNLYVQGSYYNSHGYATEQPASSGVRTQLTVTLNKNGPNDLGILASRGFFVLESGEVRAYGNASDVFFHPSTGASASEVVTFTCEVPGYAGSLAHLADENGAIATDRLNIREASGLRTGVGAQVSLVGGGASILDSGQPDTFGESDVGLYVRITQATQPNNNGRLLRIEGFEKTEVESPPGSGLYPSRVFVNQSAYEFPREVFIHDASASTYTDVTNSVLDNTTTVLLFPASPAVGDAFYVAARGGVGASYRGLAGVVVDLSVAGSGTYQLAWERWTGSAWVAVSISSDTSNMFKSLGRHHITWTNFDDHVETTSPLSGLTWNLVRARIVSGAMSTVPVVQRLTANVYWPLVNESNVYWAVEDYNNLGFYLGSANLSVDGRDDQLWLLGDDRNLTQQVGESDSQFRARASTLNDAVSPNAILRAVNTALDPFGLEGQALDHGNGLTGVFADHDYYDYYSPGDAFPDPLTDPWKLSFSLEETYGFFLIILPYMNDGDFGAFFDDGPFNSVNGSVSVGFMDSGYFDGYPINAYATYASIWQTVNAIKTGGVRFALIRDIADNLLSC